MNRMAEQITELLTIPDVLRHYGYGLGRYGRIPCPLHDGKHPNFSYTDEVYHCWSCGAKGNTIGLVMDLFKLNFGQAMLKINSDFALGLSDQKPSRREKIAIKKRQEELKLQRQEKEKRRQRYLRACGLHAVLYRRSLFEPKIDGLSEYLEQLEQWLDEHIREVRT